uniref:Uncharacterized protein n=1 Tax=Physcomitrium patens TaxID=3218 RepID=A0A2K1KNL5_PHYPA|nr:hypothetical protein PHYPA_006254 [Physcomitrium patens]
MRKWVLSGGTKPACRCFGSGADCETCAGPRTALGAWATLDFGSQLGALIPACLLAWHGPELEQSSRFVDAASGTDNRSCFAGDGYGDSLEDIPR